MNEQDPVVAPASLTEINVSTSILPRFYEHGTWVEDTGWGESPYRMEAE